MADPLDLLVDRLLAEHGDRYIRDFREYPARGTALIQYLVRLSEISAIRRILSDLDAIANNMRTLAPDLNFSGAGADELGGLIATNHSLQLQIEYFLTDKLSFELRRALFLAALVAHDLGILNLTPGDSSDVALHFLSAAFVDLFPQLPKPLRTAALCLAAERLGERAFFQAQRRGCEHIGRHAADLLALHAVQPERFAPRIEEELKTVTRITQSTVRKRGLVGTARKVADADADADGSKFDDLVCGETFEAIAELAKGRDLIELTVRPEALNVFPVRVASRIIDYSRKAMATKRSADVVDIDDLKDLLPAPDATAEDHLYLARFVRDTSDRDQQIFRLLLQGRTDKEIADALGMRPTAASKAISRLRRRLTG